MKPWIRTIYSNANTGELIVSDATHSKPVIIPVLVKFLGSSFILSPSVVYHRKFPKLDNLQTADLLIVTKDQNKILRFRGTIYLISINQVGDIDRIKESWSQISLRVRDMISLKDSKFPQLWSRTLFKFKPHFLTTQRGEESGVTVESYNLEVVK